MITLKNIRQELSQELTKRWLENLKMKQLESKSLTLLAFAQSFTVTNLRIKKNLKN